jgi:hypothetical protein
LVSTSSSMGINHWWWPRGSCVFYLCLYNLKIVFCRHAHMWVRVLLIFSLVVLHKYERRVGRFSESPVATPASVLYHCLESYQKQWWSTEAGVATGDSENLPTRLSYLWRTTNEKISKTRTRTHAHTHTRTHTHTHTHTHIYTSTKYNLQNYVCRDKKKK